MGQKYPFRDYKIKKGTPDETRLRHLTDEEISKLINQLPKIENDRYRYESILMWLAMFFGDGMNSADLARLRWDSNVKKIAPEEYQVQFRRTKTKNKSNTPVGMINNRPLSRIISHFHKSKNPSPFVFPILVHAWNRHGDKLTERHIKVAYTTRNKSIIKYMREECEKLGIEKVDQIDIYTARHSFCS